MPTAQQREQGRGDEQQARGKLHALIAERVLHTLGEPGGLHLMQVRHLWGDHYRVNVLVGENAASTRIAHSYFLVADSAGQIVTSNPNIIKRY